MAGGGAMSLMGTSTLWCLSSPMLGLKNKNKKKKGDSHGRHGGHVYDGVGDLHIGACQVQRQT